MRGEFMFGVSREKPTRRGARIMDRVARKHDADFIEVNLPGTGYQNWFATDNYGSPFNERRAMAVFNELEELGVVDSDGRLTAAYREGGDVTRGWRR